MAKQVIMYEDRLGRTFYTEKEADISTLKMRLVSHLQTMGVTDIDEDNLLERINLMKLIDSGLDAQELMDLL